MKKFTTISIFIISFFFVHNTKAQNFEWALSFGSFVYDRCSSYVDNAGNVYNAGLMSSSIDLDPGPGTFTLSPEGNNDDAYIQKLDSSGNFVWAKGFIGEGNCENRGVKVDGDGNIYTLGNFGGTIDFDPGAAVNNVTAIGNDQMYLHKMDASGNFLWVRTFGGDGFDGAESIALDASGNIYATGIFAGTGDFDPGAGSTILTSNGSGDVFVLKMDASGNFLWARSFGGTSAEVGWSIDTDSSGNVYTVGFFEGTIDFDPSSGSMNLTSVGDNDVFVQKMDASGNFLWAKAFGGPENDLTYSINVDVSNNLLITGSFEGTADFDPGTETANLTSNGDQDIFIQKLDASGNYLWAKSVGGTDADRGRDIITDASGNSYTTGIFSSDTIDLDPGTGTSTHTTPAQDAFVLKLDSAGNFVWASSFGENVFEIIETSINLDASQNVYTTGAFYTTGDFDPTVGVFNLTSNGQSDIFVQKLSQGPLGIEEFHNNPSIAIYPNPTKKNINIYFEHELQEVRLILTDVQGKILSDQSYRTFSNAAMEVKGASGLYFLNIRTSTNEKTIKILKE